MSTLANGPGAAAPLPEAYAAWQIYGAGFDNVGKEGKPVTLPLRPPAENEILLRVDALGLCLSDIKIINLGGDHPRLRGRDLATDPTVLGHECAATVAAVGERWKNRFHIGERYIVQADIYYKGMGYAFGYQIPGGLGQYCYLDERALDGDEGCYLLPVTDETGYSQAALAEPWACVEMSYNLDERLAPMSDGAMLIAGDDGSLKQRFPKADTEPSGQYDDILAVNPSPENVAKLAAHLKNNGAIFLLGKPSQDGPATLDIGRIHYEGIRFFGGGDALEAIATAHKRTDLKPGGVALFLGGGGPMGQMHVQRAVERSGGPKRVVVTDLDRGRMDHIEFRFGALAAQNGIELHTLTSGEFETQEKMDEAIRALAPEGYDDIVILAPVAGLVTSMMPLAADNALINVFAGVPVGQTAAVDVKDLCRGVKIIGSSGSRISDLRAVLELVEKGELNTNLSVAAIGGLNAAKEGLEGLRDARFPGKTVIYPQLEDLPLMALEELPEKLPALREKLTPQGAWTKEAETALLNGDR